LLELDELKSWLHKRLARLDKLLLILAAIDRPSQVKDIQSAALDAGFRDLRNWNISQYLGSSKGFAIRTRDGWELTDAGKTHLRNLGVTNINPWAMQVASDLRAHLSKISDDQTRDFVDEAIRCHESELYRAAIVMMWLGAVDVLHRHVFVSHLSAFNAEATRVMGKNWKTARSRDDLGRMSEGDFLDRLEGLSVIGKNAKAQLKAALDLRNGCGHPNSLKVGVNKSAAHIETLLQNVFERFA
jgi:hypothetical protein